MRRLDVSTADGALLQQYADFNGNNQQFRLESRTSTRTAAATAGAASSATGEQAELSVFPNPVSSNDQATLNLKAQKAQRITVLVQNKAGLVSLFTLPLQAGSTTFKLPTRLRADTYYVRTTIDEQKQNFTLLVK